MTSEYSDKEKVRRIMRVIRRAEREARRRVGWLRYQDAIALGLLAVGLSGMLASALLYLNGLLPWWGCIVVSAVFASVLHELEHDQIHQIYFRDRGWIEPVLFYLVWFARGNTPNPYYRRLLHFQHHRLSGTEHDAEERLITNGMRWSPLRLWALFDQRVAGVAQRHVLRSMPHDTGSVLGRLWVFAVFYLVWDLFVLFALAATLAALFGATLPGWAELAGSVLVPLVVVWVAPNLLRQFCLQFVSSSMHYYGDFDGALLRQTQVLNRWFLLPFQVFCFNFGSTHSIHHFVVNQPFYLRQLIAPVAHAAMRRYGVRFNDLGSFRRANRYHAVGPTAAISA